MVKKNKVLVGTPVEFASFGKSALAYVRRVQSDDMNERFPNAPALPEGLDLWGLFGADGEPLAVSDERSSLFSDAERRDLLTVHRH